MRTIGLALLALTSCCTMASAQTWDPHYPVCMQIFGPITYNDCRYTSLRQCSLSAAGGGGLCVENPYFAGARPNTQRPDRR